MRPRDGARRLRGLAAAPSGGVPVELWFDDAALLVRTRMQVGHLTITTDYGDHRDVAGAKLPFRVISDDGDARNRVTIAVTAARARDPLPDAAYAVPPPPTIASRSPAARPASSCRSS